MTFLVERLAELRMHIKHLRDLAPRVTGRAALEGDLRLRHDVLCSLLGTAQLVIDSAGELAARRGDRFEEYREAIRSLGRDRRFPPELIATLELLPGFRNVVVHEYVTLNLERAVEALQRLDPIEQFIEIVSAIESSG